MSTPIERPTSPHLSIYKPQITSVMSILHRITGVALYAGTLLLVAWLVSAAYSVPIFKLIHEFMAGWIGKALLIGWTLAFYYHLCNGIRHLFWDMGKGFELKAVTRSGVLVLLAAAGLTGLTWWYVLCAPCMGIKL